MIAGLSSSSADSTPILCITGQAPREKLDKDGFQVVDIKTTSKPLTKLSRTILEPTQLSGVFQKAVYLMRSDRPEPILLDIPI